MTAVDTMDGVERLARDLKTAARVLSHDEARFLVDAYYIMQKQRIRTSNQLRSLSETGEPAGVIEWYANQSLVLEREVHKALAAFAGASEIGEWALSICGVGPVITAGLLAHIDFTLPHVGHLYSFAGLAPNQVWKKGEKRPWNAALKTLCWKIGESFVKVQGHKSDYYGKLYAKRRALEDARNEAGEFAELARAKLSTTRIGKSTDAYKHYRDGRLPPARIYLRSKRWATKIFLAHLFAVGHWRMTGKMVPRPYALLHMDGHTDLVDVPNRPDDMPAWE